MLYCQPVIDNQKSMKNLQSELTFNSFNGCQSHGLINIKDSNISNDPNSFAIRDNVSNNISTNPICFTIIVHYQTKLLKILNDANVPNYLYNKIIDWAVEAQQSNINFADMKNKERNS